MKRPRVVVFDLGGVLIRICRSWAEACAAAGLPLRVDVEEADASGRRYELSARHGVGAMSSDEFFRAMSAALGGAYSPEEVQRVHDAWLLGEYPGVHGLIDDLRDAGVATGVLSNTNHAHWVRLTPRHMGGTDEFPACGRVDHPHASHVLGLLKPDQAIYRAFERLSGATPEEIVFFDDLAENVAAAHACGWGGKQVDHTGDTAAQMRGHLRELGVL
jgi:putative hydrolase of the HAD superfamily